MENVAPYYMVRPQTTLVAFASMPQKNSTESLDSRRPSHGTCNNSGCIDERDKSSAFQLECQFLKSKIEEGCPSIHPTNNEWVADSISRSSHQILYKVVNFLVNLCYTESI